MADRSGIVYLIRNTINRKVYVGKTVQNLDAYFADNLVAAINGSKRKPLLYRAIRKHGAPAFSVEILETCAAADLSEAEKKWIKSTQSCNSRYGYNLTTGGTGGAMVGTAYEKLRKPKSEAHRKKLSISAKARGWRATDQTRTPEARAKRSASLQGRVFSQETRAKMSQAAKGKVKGPRPAQSARMRGLGNPMAGVSMPHGHQDKLQTAVRKWRESNPEDHRLSCVKASRTSWEGMTDEQKQKRLAPMRKARWSGR